MYYYYIWINFPRPDITFGHYCIQYISMSNSKYFLFVALKHKCSGPAVSAALFFLSKTQIGFVEVPNYFSQSVLDYPLPANKLQQSAHNQKSHVHSILFSLIDAQHELSIKKCDNNKSKSENLKVYCWKHYTMWRWTQKCP